MDAGLFQHISVIQNAMTLIPIDLSASRISDAVRDPNREIAASSRVIDLSVGIVVCIPCFRRPDHLRLTLDSLVNQRTPRSFAVVMVENDAAGRASAPVAAEYLAAGKLQGICLVEKRQGNCQAINAAFETAQALFPAATRFLMIDDDEIASPDWLELMVRTAEATGADVVGGPVLPVFDDDSQPWLARHPAFCPAYDYTGAVPQIYGCGNCLITRAAFERLGSPAFDLRFNFLGGGDCDFFYRGRNAGMTFHWTAEAVITETVPQNRTSLGWIAKRSLRIGVINYRAQSKAAQGAGGAGARVCADLGTAAAVAGALGSPADVIESGRRDAPDAGGRRFCSRGIRLRSEALSGLEDRFLTRQPLDSKISQNDLDRGPWHRPRRSPTDHAEIGEGVAIPAEADRLRRRIGHEMNLGRLPQPRCGIRGQPGQDQLDR